MRFTDGNFIFPLFYSWCCRIGYLVVRQLVTIVDAPLGAMNVGSDTPCSCVLIHRYTVGNLCTFVILHDNIIEIFHDNEEFVRDQYLAVFQSKI